MAELIKDFVNTDIGKEVAGPAKDYKYSSIPELDLIKQMEVGDCVVVENGSSYRKSRYRNWKPYFYGRKFAIERGLRLKSKTVGNKQYLILLEGDGKRRHA